MKKNPCKECPFLKTSAKGWLGEASGDPERFLASQEYNIIPCHTRVAWDEEEGREMIVDGSQNPCIGGLSFLVNSCKLPRGARQEGTYSDLMDKAKANPNVFKWGNEFIKHHSILLKIAK